MHVLRALALLPLPRRVPQLRQPDGHPERPGPGQDRPDLRAAPPGPGRDPPEQLHPVGGPGRRPRRPAVQRPLLQQHLRRHPPAHHPAPAQGLHAAPPAAGPAVRAERDRPDLRRLVHREERREERRPRRRLRPARLHQAAGRRRVRPPGGQGQARTPRTARPQHDHDVPRRAQPLPEEHQRGLVAARRHGLPRPLRQAPPDRPRDRPDRGDRQQPRSRGRPDVAPGGAAGGDHRHRPRGRARPRHLHPPRRPSRPRALGPCHRRPAGPGRPLHWPFNEVPRTSTWKVRRVEITKMLRENTAPTVGTAG